MKLITNANLELIIQEFYALLQEEFKPKQLEEARTLTIGETGKKFDGSQDVFWSLNEIGAAPKDDVGSISNLTTSNKSSVVAAINELQNNKATIAYVNDAISNVEIEDVVTASEFIGDIENIENDYVTQDELEDALANLDDIDIEGMVTAVDVGDVDIEQGGGTVSSGVTVNSTYVSDANNTNDIIGYYPTSKDTLNLPPDCYNIAGDNNYSLWGILFTQVEPKYNTIVQQYIPTWGAWANVIFTRTYNSETGFTSWVYHLDSSEWDVELQTNNKSIIGAINELFQSANNGKQLIADAIGEPLDASDTFSAMSNDINRLLSQFKTNMMNNGVTVDSGDKFKQLIDKIATMVEEGSGKGIQYASGTYTTNGGAVYNTDIVVPLNLSFDPTHLFVETSFVYYNTSYNERTRNFGIVSNIDYLGLDRNSEDTNNDTSNSEVYLTNITRQSCQIDGRSSGITISSGTYNWYAIGVGEEYTTLRDSLASILQEKGVSVTEEDNMASLITKVDEKFDLLNSQKGYQLDYENGIGDVILYLDPASYEIPTTANLDVMVSWTSTIKGKCLISFRGGGNNSGFAYININRNGKVHTSNMFDYPSPANSSQVFSYIYDIEVGDIIYVTGDRTNVDPDSDSPYVAYFTISSKLAIPSSSSGGSGTGSLVDGVLYDYANQIDPCNITTATVVTTSDSKYLNNLKHEVSTQYGGLHLGLTPLGANTGLELEVAVPLLIDLGIPATTINQYSTCTLTFKAPYYTTVEFIFGFINGSLTTDNNVKYNGQTSNYNNSRTVTFNIANKYSSGNLGMYLFVIATENYPNYNIIEKITFQ